MEGFEFEERLGIAVRDLPPIRRVGERVEERGGIGWIEAVKRVVA
jgi:hypothetical protein